MAKAERSPGPRGVMLHISGLAEEQIAPVLAERLASREYADRPCLVVTPTSERVAALSKALTFFSGRDVYTVAEDAPYFLDYEFKSREDTNERVKALARFLASGDVIVVAAVSGALKRIAPPDAFLSAATRFSVGEEVDQTVAAKRLALAGYERESKVEAPGQFALRGDILDVWAPAWDEPARVHFFGDEVERIGYFDPVTQLTSPSLQSRRITVYPASDAPGAFRPGFAEDAGAESNGDEAVNMAAYLTARGLVVLDDPDRIAAVMELREKETLEDFASRLMSGDGREGDLDGFAGVKDIPLLYEGRDAFVFTPLSARPLVIAGKAMAASAGESFAAKHPAVMNGHMPLFLSEVRRYVREGFDVTIVCSTEGRLENLRDLAAGEGIGGNVRFVRGELNSGIEITTSKKVWLWDGDIFKARREGRKRRRYKGDGAALHSFTDIGAGDYVVHESHGVGRYEGLVRLEVQGSEKDYLKVRYSGGDHLYVPVEQMALIQKYIGGGEAGPKLNRLSGSEWKRAKARVRADIARMAAELAATAAERRALRGHAFAPDGEWQREFEDRFPYDETDDQLKAIARIKEDMERPQPMDRLLCGDVGYGKTEVALRAVFKCVADGKQAAVLVPTTLLASQHYATFTERFTDFPFRVEMMSRFRSAAEQKKVAKDLALGRVDVVIGTHRLLSGDIAFNDLGLLIVDEEHRFGVGHKEKIKRLKKNVDVLSLTATPIPRTLHMSLLGVRDMDLIEEPPEDRYPVQTYVMEESAEIIRETVRRELDREGQVFAVASRVSSLDRIALEITRLVPEARVAVGHGQMDEQRLEDTMADFIAGSYDVLVSTTIIESGLDIPNANTVIVFDADRFGLSQLYQIRGRVGRSNRIAFAYLLHRPGGRLSETAEKRLRTIREFTEFGAGFRIAMRDLEIRGAGNLLGPEQHGHMAAVGYELYCRMVDEAVRAFTDGGRDGAGAGAGEGAERPEPKLDAAVDAFLPQSYIEEETERIDSYHRIALIAKAEDADELLRELEDRYGPAPPPVRALTRIALARALMRAAGVGHLSVGTAAELDAAIENLISAGKT
jgi:transcription-repair coupling factor (superfamily II helicase)